MIPVTGLRGLFDESDIFNEVIEKNQVNSKKTIAERTRDSIKHIYNRLRPCEPYNFEQTTSILRQRFFETEYYDLGKADRFKIKEKVDIYNRLSGQTIAEDLISKDGEVVFERGTKLSIDDVLKLQNDKIFEGNENH